MAAGDPQLHHDRAA